MAQEKPVILYDNRLEDGTATATATDPDSRYNVANLTDKRAFTAWLGVGTSTHYVTVDCGSAKSADALGILVHNFFTAGATISVECSSDNFAADTTVALAGFVPSSDKAIFKKFDSLSKRYWRLKMTGMSAAPIMAVLVIGVKMEFEKYLNKGLNPKPEKVDGNVSVGGTGQYLGSAVEIIKYSFRPRFRRITDSWFNNTYTPAWDAHLSLLLPFFWVWDPGNHGDQVYYAWFGKGATLDASYDPVRLSLKLKFFGVKEL